MAGIDLKVGAQEFSTGFAVSKDLGKVPQDLRFILDGKLEGLLDQPLSSLPKDTSVDLAYDGGKTAWDLDGSAATFCLQPKASGTLSVKPAGKLFSYWLDFDSTELQSFDGKSGCYYVILGIGFNVSGNLSATAPAGSVGITTTDSASATFEVRNYKPFPPSTKLRDALSATFAGFSLPLHTGTVTSLEDGAAIFYELDGALSLGFGVTYGIDTAVGGFSLSEINLFFQRITKVFDVSSKSTFTAGVEAGPSVKFNWSRRFNCFLERAKPYGPDGPDAAQPGTARLHVSAGTESQRAAELSADAGILKISAPKISVNQDTLLQWIRQRAFGKDAAQPGEPFETALNQVSQQIPKYAADVNDWLAGLFEKLDPHAKISLALLFQDTNAFTSAFTWDFDLANPAFPQAWQDAVKGDFLAAMSTGAASLEPRSGFERVHYDTTKLTFTFFGIAALADIDTYFSQSAAHYAGNGQFYLDTKAGDIVSALGLDSKTSTSVYLEGVGQGSPGSAGSIDALNPQIRLHGIISARDQRDQTRQMGKVLETLGTLAPTNEAGETLASAGAAFLSFASQSHPGAATLRVIFESAALKRLAADEANWNAYAWASDQLPSVPAAQLSIWMNGYNKSYEAYSAWQNFNRKINGVTDSSGNPDPNVPADPESLSPCTPPLMRDLYGDQLTDDQAKMLIDYFCAGQQYMKLCRDLTGTIAGMNARADWRELTAKLAGIAQADINSWFGGTVLLALAKSSQVVAVVVPQWTFVPTACSATVEIS